VRADLQLPLPEVARSYDRVNQSMGLPGFRNDAALLVVRYEEGGVEYQEVLYTDVQIMMAGLWGNRDTYAARAPAREFPRMRRVFEFMRDSVTLDPRGWRARCTTRSCAAR